MCGTYDPPASDATCPRALTRLHRPRAGRAAFPSKNDPQDHLGQSTLTWIYYPARDAAGRPDLHSHDLRHTGLTWAAWSGATLAELMSRAGHSTPAMAIRYQHAAQDRDAIIAQKLSAMVGWEAEQATS